MEAQFQDTFVFSGYAQDAWVRAQGYELAWRPVPRTEPATLGYLIEDYVLHLEHHLTHARRLAEQAVTGE